MSAAPEPASGDLVAVACVVEASLLIASEWSRVLVEYVFPLLKRLTELHPLHQFRLAFVTYGAADTRPLPLLSKRFFAPLPIVTRELRDEPSKFGIGQTNSGSGRGLSALEGLVAAIELFDILMTSTNSAANHTQTQSPQKESRSLVSHLLHIAASPPDNVQRPQWNTLSHLDSVNWDSIPAELRKRKINLSLISVRKIPQFQDLYSSVAGSGVQSPWFNVHSPHVLLLAGFPAPQKGVKRQTDALLSDHSPDTKRQKVVVDPIAKTLSASPALSSARMPQSQRSIAQPPPTSVPSQNPPSAPPVQASVSAPASMTLSTSPSGPLQTSGPSLPVIDPELFGQVVTTRGDTFGQMVERLKALDKHIMGLDLQITNAQKTGQTASVADLQEDRAHKANIRDQIKPVLRQHYQKMRLAKEALSVQNGLSGSAHLDVSAEAGPSGQFHPPNVPNTSGERLTGPSVEERKLAISDSQILAQFWQSRGGTISTPSDSNPPAGPSQVQSHLALTPEMAAQMQNMMEKKTMRPQVTGMVSQTSGTMTHDTGVRHNATNNPPIHTSNATSWGVTFLWTSPRVSSQVAIKLQISVHGVFASASDIRTDIWPKNLTLNSCKTPVKDEAELSSWLRRHKPLYHLMQFTPNRSVPDGSVNEQRFHAVHKFMTDRRIYAYTGWRLPSGKVLYMFIFPMGSSFAGAVFSEGIPDLPGVGNSLDAQPLVEEAKIQPPSGLNIHPEILARMQGLEPAKQKQVLTQLMREQFARQQLQQTQQPYATSSQTSSSSLGASMPANTFGTVASISAGPHTNINGSTNAGVAYDTGGGTVSYEMMQSFLQRSAEASTSQGNLG